MSGIYIPGMEMPTHCMECPFMVSRDNDDCILQSTEANEGFENWEQMRAGCPLVPVPDHGDLIDRDKLEKDIDKYIGGEESRSRFHHWVQVQDAVIPMDKGEEK